MARKARKKAQRRTARIDASKEWAGKGRTKPSVGSARDWDVLAVWGKGKHPIFAGLAIQAASVAEDFSDGLALLANGRLQTVFPKIPPLGEWLPLYYRRNECLDLLGLLLGFGIGGKPDFPSIARWLRNVSRLPAEQQNAEWKSEFGQTILRGWGEFLKGVQELSPETRREGEAFFVHGEVPDSLAPHMPEFLAIPHMQFMIRVWLPCCLHYRKFSCQLFRRARLGDIDALEDLLRVDKSILADRQIAMHWHAAMHGKERGRARRLVKAAAGRPGGKLNPKKVKERIAGLLSFFGTALNSKVTEPEIRELFGIVARLRGAMLVDKDLPRGSDTLAKAIWRQREPWEKLYQPDKNRAAICLGEKGACDEQSRVCEKAAGQLETVLGESQDSSS